MDHKQRLSKSPLVLILVAAQCDEEFVVRCVCQMRQKNIEVLLIGLYSGPVTGTHGVWLRPDWSLADMNISGEHHAGHMLVLPGPYDCTMKLLFNPRVHELIEATFREGGLIAAMSPKTRELLVRSGLAVPEERGDGFMFQERLTAGEFIDQLVAWTQFLNEQAGI